MAGRGRKCAFIRRYPTNLGQCGLGLGNWYALHSSFYCLTCLLIPISHSNFRKVESRTLKQPPQIALAMRSAHEIGDLEEMLRELNCNVVARVRALVELTENQYRAGRVGDRRRRGDMCS